MRVCLSIIFLLFWACSHSPSNLQSRTPSQFFYSDNPGVFLFEMDGRPVANYDELVARLHPGMVLQFHDGNRFTLGERLGAGGTTVVFAIENQNDRALRLPLHEISYEQQFVEQFLDFFEEVKNDGLPIIEVYPEHSSEIGQYAVVEKIESEIRLDHYLDSGEINPLYEKDLKEIVALFAEYTEFPDFKPNQFVWDGQEWVMLDWTDEEVGKIKDFDSATPLMEILKKRPELISDFLEERSIILNRPYTPEVMQKWRERVGQYQSFSNVSESSCFAGVAHFFDL